MRVAFRLHRNDLALDQLEVLTLRDDPDLLHAQDFADRESAAVETFRRAGDRAHRSSPPRLTLYSVRRISSTL